MGRNIHGTFKPNSQRAHRLAQQTNNPLFYSDVWQAYCLTTTIYQGYPSASLSWVSYGCGPVSDTGNHQFTLYRSLGSFELATTTMTSSSQNSGPTSTETASPGSSVSELAAAQPTNDSDIITVSDPRSKTWIAGVVAGPVAALVALGAIAFWWKRRRAKKQLESSEPDNTTQYHEAPVQLPKTDEVSELPSPWSPRPVSELPTRERPVELRSPSPIYEAE